MRMNAYDVMDQVQIVVRVAETSDFPEASQEWETLVVARVQGAGVTDRREWVQDALVAALEAL